MDIRIAIGMPRCGVHDDRTCGGGKRTVLSHPRHGKRRIRGLSLSKGRPTRFRLRPIAAKGRELIVQSPAASRPHKRIRLTRFHHITSPAPIQAAMQATSRQPADNQHSFPRSMRARAPARPLRQARDWKRGPITANPISMQPQAVHNPRRDIRDRRTQRRRSLQPPTPAPRPARTISPSSQAAPVARKWPLGWPINRVCLGSGGGLQGLPGPLQGILGGQAPGANLQAPSAQGQDSGSGAPVDITDIAGAGAKAGTAIAKATSDAAKTIGQSAQQLGQTQAQDTQSLVGAADKADKTIAATAQTTLDHASNIFRRAMVGFFGLALIGAAAYFFTRPQNGQALKPA